MHAPESFVQNVLAVGEVDIVRGVGASALQFGVEIGFGFQQFIIVKTRGGNHIAEKLVASAFLDDVAISVQVGNRVFFIPGNPSRSTEPGIGEFQSRAAQGIFLGSGKVGRDAQDAFAEAITSFSGAVEIGVFHHQAFTIGGTIVSQIGFEAGVFQQRHRACFIAGVEFGIRNKLRGILFPHVFFTLGAVVHPAHFHVISIAGTQLQHVVWVKLADVEIAPIGKVFPVGDDNAGISIAAAQERLVIHVVNTFLIIAGEILHLSFPHETVFYRRFAIINVAAQVCVAIIAEAGRISQVAHIRDCVSQGGSFQNAHGIDGRNIWQADEVVKKHFIHILRGHQIVFPNVGHAFRSSFVAIQALHQVSYFSASGCNLVFFQPQRNHSQVFNPQQGFLVDGRYFPQLVDI